VMHPAAGKLRHLRSDSGYPQINGLIQPMLSKNWQLGPSEKRHLRRYNVSSDKAGNRNSQ